MQKEKYYLMQYIKPENKFLSKKNIIIVIPLIIFLIAGISFLLIFTGKKKEITLKNTQIIIEKNENPRSDIKRGEFKKEEIIINDKKYTKYIYVVQKNDTLSKIAGKFLSDAYKWKDIHKYNENIKNPHWIRIDQQILIYIPVKN